MAVTITQLAAFLAVTRLGSVTGAAEELVVTQPSVSAAISALEREHRIVAAMARPHPRGREPCPWMAG